MPAAVESAPLDQVVQHVLEVSDNEGAEVLARQVAVGAGLPASFSGAAEAVEAALADLGIKTGKDRILDGSGLSRADRLRPETLLRVIESEPPGLYRGAVELVDGRVVPGILFDESIAKTHPEITALGGWREYLDSRSDVSKSSGKRR